MEGPKIEIKTLESILRSYALGMPETYEEFPWGHRALKVRGKTFMFMHAEPGELSLSVKLPESKEFALSLPFTQPTAYGLGKSGWVSSSFTVGEIPSLEMLKSWVSESYRAIAPKKLSKMLGAAASGPGESARPEGEPEGEA
ncbi:MAG TPA: MmcQ/YjbR family DNA-binding protein, partial [Pyrinomonadaceae bacterium]|nr:MmcQ/YjbR family DNA-binding protein [Pyrinomonadaceae bacterium]